MAVGWQPAIPPACEAASQPASLPACLSARQQASGSKKGRKCHAQRNAYGEHATEAGRAVLTVLTILPAEFRGFDVRIRSFARDWRNIGFFQTPQVHSEEIQEISLSITNTIDNFEFFSKSFMCDHLFQMEKFPDSRVVGENSPVTTQGSFSY